MSRLEKGKIEDESAPRPLILHVDMDAFFASVEVRSDPRLEGKPVAVGGGPGDRGVVTTASYAARPFGVRSGMSLAEARRLCPRLFVIPVDPVKMIHESLAVLRVLDRFSGTVEPASIDEAYLEMRPVPEGHWEERAVTVAGEVRSAVQETRGLSCTVGAGTNKLQAKMASRRGKPGGVFVVPPHSFLSLFGDRPVEDIPGIGPKTGEALRRDGVVTVADLTRADPDRLRARFGVWGPQLRCGANGEDDRPVLGEGEDPAPKSAGHETTFARDTSDPRYLRATLLLLADRVARRLRRGGYRARTVVVRYTIGRTRGSRQEMFADPVDRPDILAAAAWRLLESVRRGRAVRRLGVAGAGLGESASRWLFAADEKRDSVHRVGDRIRDRFGEARFLPAGALLRGRPAGKKSR